jgi:membrane-associated protease RseP (regulator of RpoE activity)
MQPQQNIGNPGAGEQFCAQCGAPMPKELRFCRACGHRLGEGPAEYTETVRFPGTTAPSRGGQTTPFYPTFNAPMTTVDPPRRRPRFGLKGMTWLWIVLVAVFAFGGLMSLARKPRIPRPPFAAVAEANRSWVGVNQFDNTDVGATFKYIDAPGGPADKAGLVGGDIITSFDGQAVGKQNEMMDVLRRTPIGKTVEVIFLRDGVSRKTQMTTVSRDEYNRISDLYERRAEGNGLFGFERGRMTRITSPETNTYGVRIDYVEPNRPADLFGIKKGDIITDFDNIPIRTSDEFYMRVRRTIPYTTVNITVLREGQKMVIPVRIGKA